MTKEQNEEGLARRQIDALHARGGEQFHRLLDNLPAAAYTCDPDGLITYFNQHAADLWGHTPKLGDPESRFCGSFRLFSSDGDPITHDQCWMALALRDNREFLGEEIVIERPDGRRFTALAHAYPFRDDSGTLLGAVNVLVDVSELKQAEEKLKKADRAKNEFLATLAHELRNPLAPIRNAVQVLHLKGGLIPELQWALGVIDRQVQQMARLIEDLLDVARISGDKLELRRERVELAEVIEEAVETSRPVIDACGHEFIVTASSRPIFLDGDLTRLAQVISNLLGNAAKYTERGGRIWLTADREGNDAVVKVRDNGIGIPPEMMPHIFEMFTQVDRSLNRSRGGLGIGLTLVRRLVDMHGGTIDVHSDGEGKGSEFVIRLPVATQPVEIRQKAALGEERAVLPESSLRILVVDDIPDCATSLGLLLGNLGNDVRTTHDGLAAIAAAEEYRPDVVLLDIGLPKMSGYDAARAIRRQPWGKDIVLIALTGWGQEKDVRLAQEAGFDHHLVKPADPAVLTRILASVKQSASSPQSVPTPKTPRAHRRRRLAASSATAGDSRSEGPTIIRPAAHRWDEARQPGRTPPSWPSSSARPAASPRLPRSRTKRTGR
jgi:PAS domain S-box-containing protein